MADDDVLDPAAEAQSAREAAAFSVAGRQTRGPLPQSETPEHEEDYSVLPSDRRETQAPGDIDIGERFRLDRLDSFYRGTLAGSGRLSELARVATSPQDSLTDAERKMRPAWSKEYDGIVADLARYDLMRPWGTTMEGIAAFGGTLAGGMTSPESWLGFPARGGTALFRTAKAAVQQGVIQGTVDPIVQYLNGQAGVQQGDWDSTRTFTAFGLGAIIGGGLHAAGELIPAPKVRQLRADLASEDPAFQGDVERRAMAEAASGAAPPDELPSDTRFKQLVADITRQVQDGLLTYEEGVQKLAELNGEQPQGAAGKPTAEEGTPAAEEAPPAAPPKAAETVESEQAAATPAIEDASAWTKIGGQKGSNPGGTYQDTSGAKWYVKTPKTEDHARNEVLANTLYNMAGADVPELKLVSMNGQPAVASRMLPPSNKKLGDITTDAQWNHALQYLRKDFAADAWLANHDVIGLSHDNVMVDHVGNPVRIDQGGALRYRAQGEPKTNFGPDVGEFESMRNEKIAPQAGPIFGKMTDQDLVNSINRVLLVDPQDIGDAVAKFGPLDPLENEKLGDTLIARQHYLRKIRDDLKAKIAAKLQETPPVQPKPPPAPTATANPSEHAVTWGKTGGGKPISETNPGKPVAVVAHGPSGVSVPAGPHIPVNGPPLKSAQPLKDWNKAAGINKALAKTEGPIFVGKSGKAPASGVIIREPDGRVWIVKPANGFGGYEHTFPKGKLEDGLSLQANAIKEAFEESGLKVKITGLLNDFTGDTSVTRYYWAERTGGHPKDAHWESEAVKLVPASDLFDYLNKPRDQEVAAKAFGGALKPGKHGDPANVSVTAGTVPAPAAGSSATLEGPAKKWLKANMANVHTDSEVDAMSATEAVERARQHGWKPPGAPKIGIPTEAGSHPTLPMDEASRYARAEQMGFDTSTIWYHGTSAKFEAFDVTKNQYEPAIFLARKEGDAKHWGKAVYPLFSRAKRIMTVGPEHGTEALHYSTSLFKKKINEARAQGYDAVLFKNVSDVGGTYDQFAVLHPNLLRSIHAAFDPAEVASPKLAAIKPGKEGLAPEEFEQGYQDMLDQARDDMVEAQERGEDVRPAQAETPDLQAIAQRKSGGTLSGEQQRPAAGVPGTAVTTPSGTAVGPPGSPGATGGAAPGPSPRDVAIRSLQQQVMDLAKALDLPVREGRVQIKGAIGQFNSLSGVARVKEIPDLVVVAHEAGHAIEAKVGSDLTNLINSFAYELGPLDYDWPNQARPAEGFAEYIRHFIGNPAYAQSSAPNFDTLFRNFMQARAPDMLKALDDAAKAYQAWLQAPSGVVTGSTVRFADEEGNAFARMMAKIREDGLFPSIKQVLQRVYTTVLDDKSPVTRAVRDLGRAIREADPNHALVNLTMAENPDILLRLAGRSQQAAVRDMMDGVRPYHGVDPQGPSLAAAISRAVGAPSWMGRWDRELTKEFSRYLVDRRAEVLWGKFERGEIPNPPVSFSKADAIQAMAEREAANPTFREAGDMVHAYTREVLRKQYEGGLIDKDLYDKLLKEEFYVPFMRDMSDKPLASEASAGSGAPGAFEGPGMTQTVKGIKGSARDVIDPLESIMMQTFLVNRTLAHNDVIRSFVDLARRAVGTGGKYVEVLPAHEARKYTFDLADALRRKALEHGATPEDAEALAAGVADKFGEDPLMGSFFRMEPAQKRGEPLVFYKEGGKLKVARFMSEKEGHALYETLTAMPEPITDLWHDLVRTAATIKRTGIIANPTFALSNYIRDQLAVSILRRDYIPFIGGVKGIVSEVTQGEAARLYGYAGGVAGGASTGPVEHAAEAEIDALAKQGYLVNRVTSVKGLLELASITEAGTRNSVFDTVFKEKKALGLSDYEAMIEAAYDAQDILDFSRHGSRTLAIRNILPFINAHMQGLDKAWRTIVDPLVKKLTGDQVFAYEPDEFNNAVAAAVKVGGLGAVLGVAWAALNWDKEAYRDASPYFKGTHLIVPWGDKLLIVPKPFELAMGFTAGEYAFQALMHDDPRMAQQFLNATWQAVGPPSVLTDIPLVSTASELYLGKSLFTGNDIVPGALQRLPAAQQYNDRTSSLARYIGEMIGVSPMKVDYAIGSQFGTWGRDIMALSQGVDENSPTANWEDRVFFRRFIKDPTRTSDITTRFWQYMGQTSGTYNQDVAGYDNFVRLHDDAGAAEFLNRLPPRERAFVTLKSAATEDGKPAFKADEKRLHPLQRAYDAVEILNAMRRDLVTNNVSRWQDGAPLKLSPDNRRDLLDNIRELAQMEMRNAFVMMKEPGYAGRPLLDTNATMEKIFHISPEAADEIATRYATNRIYTTDAVAKAYPQMERALLRDGSEADLMGLALDAKADGYAFGGDRVRRPQKRRVVIPGQPAAAGGP